MSTTKPPVTVEHVDEVGNRLELLANVGSPTMFVTVARAADDEDDEHVFEIDTDRLVGMVAEALSLDTHCMVRTQRGGTCRRRTKGGPCYLHRGHVAAVTARVRKLFGMPAT